MALDRITEAVADRTDPTKRHLDAAAKRRLRIESLGVAAAIVGTVVVAKAIGVSGDFPERAGVRQRAVTAQEWLLAQIQKVLDYVQDPTSWVFQITEPVGNFILTKLLLPLQAFLVEAPWFTTLGGLTLIAFVDLGPAAGDHDVPHARPDRLHGGLGARDGHALPGPRRHAHRRDPRLRPRRLGVGEPHRLAGHAADQRRAADPAAARLHHPVHLPDAGLDRARDRGRRAVRVPGRRPARGARPQGRGARDASRRRARSARHAGRCCAR